MRKVRFISLAVCVSLLLSVFSVSAYAEETTLKGDVDGNGKVNTEDARQILRMASCIIPEDLAVADMNDDGLVSTADAIAALNTASGIVPEKNGDNKLSVDPDNEFIKIVTTKYPSVNPAALVAIYSVPDSGTNYVLQFKSKNNYEKSPDNLERVYHIGKAPQRELSYTEGKLLSGNYNCDAASGMVTFEMIKTKVMPQHPDYFVGL